VFRIIIGITGLLLLLLSTSISFAGPSPDKEKEKLVSGMSIVGNDEAPKSLVIVPWKSSDLGDSPGVSKLMDDGRNPVDREVFMRALDYYEIRTGSP
jgi:hypothetical protein